MNSPTAAFFADVGRKISYMSGYAREAIFFLFQRVSITIERFNSVLFRESFISGDDTED